MALDLGMKLKVWHKLVLVCVICAFLVGLVTLVIENL